MRMTRRGGGDVEALAPVRDHVAERVSGLLRRPEDREPSVRDVEGLRNRLRAHDGEVDGDVGAERPRHQLQRLAEPRPVCDGDVVVLAVVLHELPSQRGAHDLDVLARLLERLAPVLAVPALDDLRARGAEAEEKAPAGEQVERRRRHRRVRRRAAGDLHDRAAELDPLGRRTEPREHGDAVRSPCLRRPCRVVAEPLGLLRHRDGLERARPRRRVAHVEAETHYVSPVRIGICLVRC